MKIKIKDQTYDLHYSTRMYIIYENVVEQYKKDGIEVQPDSITATHILLYGAIQSTLKHNKVNDFPAYDDVIDILDENGGMKFLNDFGKWLVDNVNAQVDLAPVQEEDKDKEKGKKK